MGKKIFKKTLRKIVACLVSFTLLTEMIPGIGLGEKKAYAATGEINVFQEMFVNNESVAGSPFSDEYNLVGDWAELGIINARSAIKFHLSGYSGKITSAKLKLNVGRRDDSNFEPDTATFDLYSAGNDWDSSSTAAQLEGSLIKQGITVNKPSMVGQLNIQEIDVTDFMKNQSVGEGQYVSFLLKAPIQDPASNINFFGFASKNKLPEGGSKLEITTEPIQNSTISPSTASFDKNTSKQADINVNMTLNGNTLTNIMNGGSTLTNGTDYIVSGNTVTITKSYLAKQNVGTTNLTFNFSEGNAQTLSIIVSETTKNLIDTWEKLRTAIRAVPDNTPTTIEIDGDIEANSEATNEYMYIQRNKDITIQNASGKSYSIKRGSSNTRTNLFYVSGKLTLKDITIDGNNIETTDCNLIYVFSNGGELILDRGATIQNVNGNGDGGQSGGIDIGGGKLTMKDGSTIRNIKSDTYAVNLGGSTSTMTVSGNVQIIGNTKKDGTTPANVLIPNGVIINIDNEGLKADSRIGISTQYSPSDSKDISITGTNAADYSSNFISDNSDYYVVNDANVVKTRCINNQNKPTNLEAVKPTVYGKADGKITGTTTEMEYKLSADSVWIPAKDTEITGLKAGAYNVRYAAKKGFYAGDIAIVAVEEGPNAEQLAPTGLDIVRPTGYGKSDGKITGTTAEMEYKLSTDSTWTKVTGTEITGLKAGNYNVRYTAKTGVNASPSVDVVVEEGPNAEQVAPTGLSGVSTTIYGRVDGKITGTTVEMEYRLAIDNRLFVNNNLFIGNRLLAGGAWTLATATEITGLKAGTYNVRYAAKTGFNASPSVEIVVGEGPNAEKVAPTSLNGVSTTVYGREDGKITGTTAEMEYKLSTDSAWIPATATEITGLKAGNYNVRYAAKTGFNASPSVEIVVGEGSNADQLAPIGLSGVNTTVYGNSDGKITGTTTEMEYMLSTDSSWTKVTGTEITGLKAGTYNVRYAAKLGFNASPSVEVVVGEGPNADQLAPTGLSGANTTVYGRADGKIIGTTVEMEYRLSTDSSWTKITATEITGLKAGTYNVRYAAKTGFNASPSVEVVVGEAPKTEVEVKPNTPPTVVEGLKDLFKEPTVDDPTKGITQEDLNEIAKGGKVEIKLTAEKKDEAAVAEDAAKLKAEAGDKKALMLIDLTVTKKINNEAPMRLKELNGLIKVVIEIPNELRGNAGLSVLRIHEGIAETLSTDTTGEYFKVEGNYIHIFVKKFSTYAIAYDKSGNGENPGGGGNQNAEQSAPTGLNGVNTTVYGRSDGKITGTTTEMEYMLSTDSSWTKVTGTEITGLKAGTYSVRYAAKTGFNASPSVDVVVGEGENAGQASPTGLNGVNTTVYGRSDGKITGTTTEMEYMLSTDSSWTKVTGTEITGLKAGTYSVRYAAKTGFNASPSTTVVVGEGANAEQSAPTGLNGVNPTVYGNSDGKITGTTTEMEYMLSTDSSWTKVTGTEITGLKAGTYSVRYAAKTGFNASPSTTVVIGEGPNGDNSGGNNPGGGNNQGGSNPGDGTNPEEGNGTGNNVDKIPPTQNKDELDDVPKTGDMGGNNQTYGVVTLLLFIGFALFRRRENKCEKL